MENTEVKEIKENKSNKAIIIVLIIIILCLAGAVYYFATKETPVDNCRILTEEEKQKIESKEENDTKEINDTKEENDTKEKNENKELTIEEQYKNYLKNRKNGLVKTLSAKGNFYGEEQNKYKVGKQESVLLGGEEVANVYISDKDLVLKVNDLEIDKDVLTYLVSPMGNGGYYTLIYLKSNGDVYTYQFTAKLYDKEDVKSKKINLNGKYVIGFEGASTPGAGIILVYTLDGNMYYVSGNNLESAI